MTTAPNNPCVRNCCLNDDDICLGCGRALDEILHWHQASDSERLAIVARARTRLQTASGFCHKRHQEP